jgi:hypothetical protein
VYNVSPLVHHSLPHNCHESICEMGLQVAELTVQEKAAQSREKSRMAALSKDAKGSAKLSSFFTKR